MLLVLAPAGGLYPSPGFCWLVAGRSSPVTPPQDLRLVPIFVSVAANPYAAPSACRGAAFISRPHWRTLEGDGFILAKLSPFAFRGYAIGGEVPGLLASGRGLPFVIARHRDQAARAFECIAKEWLCFYRFGARVERRHLRFLERLAPPARYQPPAHADQVALAVPLDHEVDRIGGADVVPRRHVVRRRRQR